MSFCLLPLSWFLLPNSPSELRWLTPEESAVLKKRALLNRKYYDERDQFDLKVIASAFKDWRMYVHNREWLV